MAAWGHGCGSGNVWECVWQGEGLNASEASDECWKKSCCGLDDVWEVVLWVYPASAEPVALRVYAYLR